MLKGVYSVLPTPFAPNGEIDTPSLKRVIDLYIRAGVDGLTASGVTSETARLSDAERLSVLETVMAHVNKRVPVVIGASTEGLRTCIELSKKAKALGATAVMISPPRMPKLNSEAVVRHFRSVADAIDIPIIIQDYPPVSSFTMEASLLVRIARELPSARTIKLEDAPTPYKTARVLEHADGLTIGIFGGLGGTYLLEELMAGATGAMTGFAVPEVLVNVVKLFHAGERDKAADAFYRNVALMRFEFQEGIGMAIRKEMLRRRGAIAHAGIRPPGTPLEASTQKALDALLNWFLQQNTEIKWTLD
ncbi:MAG: dihydrodipicolinate synthase family protein [bacterium]